MDQRLKDDLSVFWDVTKNIVFLSSIMLFFSGWNYLHYYFAEFGLSINDVTFEFTTFYMYAYYLLSDSFNLFLFSFLILGYLLLYYFRSKIIRTFFFLFFLLTTSYFPFEYFISKNIAQENAKAILNGKLKVFPIYFNFKSDFLKSTERQIMQNDQCFLDSNIIVLNVYDVNKTNRMRALNKNFNLYIFFSTNENYYVFYNPNNPNTFTKSISIFVIPRNSVNFSSLSIDKQK